MFDECNLLTTLDLSSFNTAKVESMHDMFHACNNLTTIYVGDGWSTDAVTSSYNMFQYCYSLVGGQGTTYEDSNPMDHTYAHIDGGPSNPGYLTDINPPVAQVWYTPENTTLTFYYNRQSSNREGVTYYLNEGTDMPGWHEDGTYEAVTQVVFDPSFADARPTTTANWFSDMSNLQGITGIEYLNTDEVTNMNNMFNFCSSLTSLDLSSFNTAKVTNMGAMFFCCSSLTSLDVSSFNTVEVTNMGLMFCGCTRLTTLDLSSFNTAKVHDTFRMFHECFRLTTIYASNDWSNTANTNHGDMFLYCNNLVGGQGTTYDANHIDAEYAHIDGGPSNPGYFTAKFTRGDVNDDGNVTITDVTALINYLLSHNTTGVNIDAADCNQDTNVTITDVTALINYLLSHSW